MIEHIVLFEMKPGIDAQKEEELIQRLLALKDKIPGIVDITAGKDFSGRGGAYSIGLVVRMKDRETLQAYGPHPAHQEVVRFVEEVCASRVVIDYEIPGGEER